MTRFSALAITFGCALACAGCGNDSGRYPVSGKVLYKGEPAVGATVTFLRKEADRRKESPVQGVVREDGSFALAGPNGPGSLPGEYVVLVEWKEGAGQIERERAPALSAPDRLKGRYHDPEQAAVDSKGRAGHEQAVTVRAAVT